VPDAGVANDMVVIRGSELQAGLADPAKFRAWCVGVEPDAGFCDELVKRAKPVTRKTKLGSFAIDRFEVTQGQLVTWVNGELASGKATIKGDHVLGPDQQPWMFPACDAVNSMRIENATVVADAPDHAAACVTFRAAAAYCRTHDARLPQLAEWQLAAGGTEYRTLPWGDRLPICSDVIFGRTEGGKCATLPEGPQSVSAGAKDVTADGVRGLGGNVSEWVDDPSTPFDGPKHIAAGGSWSGGVAELATGKLLVFTPARDNDPSAQTTIGFRCAMEIK